MKTIQIHTAQHVDIEYELASTLDRIMAFLLDILILGGSIYLLAILTLAAWANNTAMDSGWITILLGVIPLLGFFSYFFLMESLNNGQTIGKRALGLQVVRLDGDDPGLSDYMLRSVFHLIESLGSGGMLGILMIATSANKQRLGDMAANTCVIKLRSNKTLSLVNLQKIGSAQEGVQVIYPQANSLREEEVLMIKAVLERYKQYPNEAHANLINETAGRVTKILDIPYPAQNRVQLLQTVLRDYILLTR